METPIAAPSLSWGSVVGLLIPFIAFYLGIYMRHALRRVFPDDVLGLPELMLMGILFSIFSVAPLLPAFNAASGSGRIENYLLTLAVVIQGGLFMPESLARAIQRRGRGQAPATGVLPEVTAPDNDEKASGEPPARADG